MRIGIFIINFVFVMAKCVVSSKYDFAVNIHNFPIRNFGEIIGDIEVAKVPPLIHVSVCSLNKRFSCFFQLLNNFATSPVTL